MDDRSMELKAAVMIDLLRPWGPTMLIGLAWFSLASCAVNLRSPLDASSVAGVQLLVQSVGSGTAFDTTIHHRPSRALEQNREAAVRVFETVGRSHEVAILVFLVLAFVGGLVCIFRELPDP